METGMKVITVILFLFTCSTTAVMAQPENAAIAKGNKLYKEGKFDEAAAAYQEALMQNPLNAVARYNLAAARFRTTKYEDAAKAYSETVENTGDNLLKHKSTYNAGVSLTKQNKLLESIAAYKAALRLNPEDADTRFNLQKALEELRKQQQKNSPEQKQQEKQKEKKPEPQKQPPASKKQIEQWLQSLRQKEQEVQQKMQQNKNRSVNKPEKDW
jgi:Ca-activated chloride channel homolog